MAGICRHSPNGFTNPETSDEIHAPSAAKLSVTALGTAFQLSSGPSAIKTVAAEFATVESAGMRTLSHAASEDHSDAARTPNGLPHEKSGPAECHPDHAAAKPVFP
jgi:hypothetical protein